MRIVFAGLHLDPLGRDPDVLLESAWPGFARPAAAARRADVYVTIVQASCKDAERDIHGVRCHFVRAPSSRLLDRIADLSPDVIHFEGLILPRRVRALSRTLPHVPILAQDHGTRCPRSWRRWWYRWGFAPLAGVAFTARAQAAPFVVAGIFPPSLPVFEVVEVSSTFTLGDRQAARASTRLDGDPCLLWTGNLDANKDPLCVLNAVGLAVARLPDLRLYMAFRQAPLLSAVQARIEADAVLRSRVRLLGTVPHDTLEAYFQAADFFVQASHVESTGAAIVEALACGTTPVVTDIPSFRSLTAEGKYGALAPIEDSRAFAQAIVEWAQRDRETLRRRAREHFEHALSFDAMGTQLRTAYAALRRPR